jgi:hypothetical protein
MDVRLALPCVWSSGNVYCRFAKIDVLMTDPISGELKPKMVFLIFYKSATIERKITKICDAFSARRYPVPDLDDRWGPVMMMMMMMMKPSLQ